MKRYILALIVVVVGSLFILEYNSNQINPSKHTVHLKNGDSYVRTNPNNKTSDNIGENRNDTFISIVVLLFVVGFLYFYFNGSNIPKDDINSNAVNEENSDKTFESKKTSINSSQSYRNQILLKENADLNTSNKEEKIESERLKLLAFEYLEKQYTEFGEKKVRDTLIQFNNQIKETTIVSIISKIKTKHLGETNEVSVSGGICESITDEIVQRDYNSEPDNQNRSRKMLEILGQQKGFTHKQRLVLDRLLELAKEKGKI